MGERRANVVSSYTVKRSLLPETYEVFRAWDLRRSQRENVTLFRVSNPTGLRSRKWLEDVVKTINRRFDTDGRDLILVELAQAGVPMDVWRPIVLWHMTRDEFLVRDFLSGWLADQHAEGTWRLRVTDVEPYLHALHGRSGIEIKEAWSPSTTNRVASGLLRMAVDFGLMSGTLAREFVPYHLPDAAFLYVLHAATEAEPNAHRMVHAVDWRMFLMGPADVQRELFRLHQHGRLRYEVAGSVAELRLPYATARDYARAELIA
jgi:hypothetical protein